MSRVFDGDNSAWGDALPLGDGLATDLQPSPQFHRTTDDIKRLDEELVFHDQQCKLCLPCCLEEKVSFTFLANGKQRFHNAGVRNTGNHTAMTLGKRLKAARLAVKLTQADVAAHFCITRPSVTQWESDTTVPELEKIKILAELYGTSASALLGQSTDRQDRISRAAKLMEQLDDDDQEWYVKSLERDVQKKQRGGA